INDVIVDLARIIQPNMNIVDARVGVEGWNGPKTHTLNAFIMGRDPGSVDAVMTQIMGFEPSTIRHLVDSVKYGLGSLDPEVTGEKIESVMVQFDPP
ncbi:MAG: DUF362 domain-containing protein, partial [Candidatus Hodarchaeota archaeon]